MAGSGLFHLVRCCLPSVGDTMSLVARGASLHCRGARARKRTQGHRIARDSDMTPRDLIARVHGTPSTISPHVHDSLNAWEELSARRGDRRSALNRLMYEGRAHTCLSLCGDVECASNSFFIDVVTIPSHLADSSHSHDILRCALTVLCVAEVCIWVTCDVSRSVLLRTTTSCDSGGRCREPPSQVPLSRLVLVPLSEAPGQITERHFVASYTMSRIPQVPFRLRSDG